MNDGYPFYISHSADVSKERRLGKRRDILLRSIGIEEFIFGCIMLLIFILFIVSNLLAEISYEPHYKEMNISLDNKLTYGISIYNVGSSYVKVRFSAVGIDQIGIDFNPKSVRINHGTPELINVTIDTKGALPGDYQGYIYVQNEKNQQVIEKIPLIIKVNSDSLKKVYVC